MGASGDQRTVEEVLTALELEPSLCDAYVEGDSDAFFYGWHFRCSGLAVTVRPIQAIYISEDDRLKYGLSDGARSDVLCLAYMAEAAVSNSLRGHLIAMIDLDFDVLLGNGRPQGTYVWTTTYTSKEMFGYNSETLGRLLATVLHVSDGSDAGDLLKSHEVMLRLLGCSRAALHTSDPPIKAIAGVTSCCRTPGHDAPFDVVDFITRSVLGSGISGDKSGLIATTVAEAERLYTDGPDDPRMSIRGHDLAQVLCWSLGNRIKNVPLRQWQAFEAALLGCISADILDADPALTELRELVDWTRIA